MREYWIVLGNERLVEVYRRPENGHYQEMRRFGVDDTVECAGVPELKIRFSELFA